MINVEYIHALLVGPIFFLALGVFTAGSIYRIVWYFRGLDWRLDRLAYKPGLKFGLKGGLHSIGKWLVPYGTHGWRQYPFLAFCFFLFHAGILLVPPFLAGHNEILRFRFGFSLPSVPQVVSDVLTAGALVAGLFLLLRRLVLPQVRLLSTWRDYGILCVALAPLVTGFLNRFCGGGTSVWLLAHIVSVELLLILAPFTKLSHMFLFFASRWQIGADYAIKRGGRSRGPYFPW